MGKEQQVAKKPQPEYHEPTKAEERQHALDDWKFAHSDKDQGLVAWSCPSEPRMRG